MSIIKKFLNLFKSGKGEEDEARLRAQKERYDNLLRALTEGDLDARWAAVRSVGDLGEPFIEPLIQGLKDEYWIIRRGSADTLGKIGAPAVKPLIGALDEPLEDIRQETIRALQTDRGTFRRSPRAGNEARPPADPARGSPGTRYHG